MKTAKLIHNPTAGDEEHSKKQLISTIEANGFECIYSSTKKKSWKDIEPEIDFVIVAGGDGTVRKIIKELLDRKILEKTVPIALLPLGTSNNIARTLEISGSTEEIIQSWHTGEIKKYDVGVLSNGEQIDFFLEGFGYGIFPYLMQEMKNHGRESIESPEAKIQAALELLHRITLSYEPRYCHLVVNGEDRSGKYLLAEIMNTRSIGPGLMLSPAADPGDGEMEVVVVTDEHKDRFVAYVDGKIKGIEEEHLFDTFKGEEVQISWAGTHVHVDDKIIKKEKSLEVKIEVKEGLLEFLVPKK